MPEELTYEELKKQMEEFRQSWFMVLATWLLQNNLEVTVTSEELETAKNLSISKFDNEDGSVTFRGELKFAEAVENA